MNNPEMKLRPKKSVCHNIEKIKSIRNKQKQIIFAHKTPNLYLQTYFPLLILGVRSLKEVNLFLKLNHILPTLWRLASSPWRALTPHHSVQRTTRVPTVHRRFYTNRLMENVVSLDFTPPRLLRWHHHADLHPQSKELSVLSLVCVIQEMSVQPPANTRVCDHSRRWHQFHVSLQFPFSRSDNLEEQL